jgi:hypothetical protein
LAQLIGLLRSAGIFWQFWGEFLGYLEWLGPNHKYFFQTEGPAIIFPNAQTATKFSRSSGAQMKNAKELWIYRIYFPMENPVDRVHGAWTGATWLRSTVDRGARVLGLASAH